jgi:hypothetical protein
MRWSVGRRLEFIDFRLYWEGRINRKDLTEFFDISVPQASSDLKTYQEKAPKNIEYDKSGKFYFATPNFKPLFKTADSSHYFAQLRLIFNKVLKEEESFLGQVPSFGSIPSVARVVDPEILRKILQAINSKMSMEINYQSMSRDQPIWRKIAPHTLAYDGFRWHIRAYCYIHHDFRDFLLVRIQELRDSQPVVIDSSADICWHNYIEVKIQPHPGLSKAQKKMIERDYGMENGVGTIKVRAALYFYLEKHLGLDEGCASRPAREQQIILVNRDEIKKMRARYNA